MNNWDKFWLGASSEKFSLVARLHHKVNFTVYKKFLDPFSLKDIKVLEIGCGTGELSARIVKRYGGSATLIDQSKQALSLAKKRFEQYGLKGRFLNRDLFKLRLGKRFDVVHSEGLIEHFVGKQQQKVLNAHKKHLKRNGFLIISVPRPAWYYKIAKYVLEKTDKWPFGFEDAMDKDRLRRILKNNNFKVIKALEYTRYSFALAKI